MAQAIHAAFLFAQNHPDLTRDWMHNSQYLIVVNVPDEAALLDLATHATDRGIPHVTWAEPDLNDTFTAVALAPGEPARRLCSNLPLAGRTSTPTPAGSEGAMAGS